MQRYGDRLLGYWEGKNGEDGLDGARQQREAPQPPTSSEGAGTPVADTTVRHSSCVHDNGPSNGPTSDPAANADNEAMAVDTPPTNPTNTDSPSDSTTTHPPPPSASSGGIPSQGSHTGSSIPPRGRERDPRSTPSSVTFEEPQSHRHPAIASGLRDWVRGDEVMGGVGRITRPIRD